jgi:hypothetical protein
MEVKITIIALSQVNVSRCILIINLIGAFNIKTHWCVSYEMCTDAFM